MPEPSIAAALVLWWLPRRSRTANVPTSTRVICGCRPWTEESARSVTGSAINLFMFVRMLCLRIVFA